MVSFGGELLTAAIAGAESSPAALRHVAELPARSARPAGWPDWAEPGVVRAFVDHGVETPWSHQVAAADLAHAGQHVVISTGTASGKSLAFQLPIMDALARDPRARALYLSPTKALGHDQLRTAHALTAATRGSLNVGRDYFRVRVDTGQIFDIYYDRAMKSVDKRKGEWLLYRELE